MRLPDEREDGPEPPPLLERGGGGGGAELPLVRLSPVIGRLRCSEEEKDSHLSSSFKITNLRCFWMASSG